MVELWSYAITLIGTVLTMLIDIILCDAFFPRKRTGHTYWLFFAIATVASYSFSILVGSRLGYAFKILIEVTIFFVLCSTLYQSRWDRCLFVVVTYYAVLYSSTHWYDALWIHVLNMTYEEYIWNIPLYSAAFFLRLLTIAVISLIIRKHHQPLCVGTQARAWVPLSVVFPLSTLLIIWQIYTFPNEQRIWQDCLLILDVVDVVALLLLDYLELSASNREKLVATAERVHVQDENIQALSQAYTMQRKMTHDYRAQLSTLSNLLDQGNLDEAKAFLSEMKDRQSERILLINTHNATIDAILNQKGYAGQQRGIDIRFRVNDLSALKLPRVDLTIVLANLLDNAMEACSQMSEADRWISVQLLYGQGILSITIINPSRPVQIVGGQISTTKPDPLLHGFGLHNVEDILDRYQAEYTFSFENGRFIFIADWPDVKG